MHSGCNVSENNHLKGFNVGKLSLKPFLMAIKNAHMVSIKVALLRVPGRWI
jgi:hypothetical protein